MIRKNALIGCLSLVVAVLAPPTLPAGDASPVPPSAPPSTASPNSLLSGGWGLSGNIEDSRLSGGQIRFTNRFTLDGHYDHGRFLVNLTPQDSEDNVAESAGWDGELFYLKAACWWMIMAAAPCCFPTTKGSWISVSFIP